MLKIASLTFNPIQENTYVVWDDTLECIVVDAGNSTPRENAALQEFIERNGLKPVLAVNTHGHFDHTLGVEFLKQTYGIPFALSAKDAFLLDGAALSGGIYGVHVGKMPSIDLDLDGQAEIRFGHTVLQVIPTPGHTPGHVSLYEPTEGILFTGDTLFRESIGRTDLPGGDYSWIMRSILERLVPLGDRVRVYPGHGPETTIGHETLYNPFIVEVLNNEVNYKGCPQSFARSCFCSWPQAGSTRPEPAKPRRTPPAADLTRSPGVPRFPPTKRPARSPSCSMRAITGS